MTLIRLEDATNFGYTPFIRFEHAAPIHTLILNISIPPIARVDTTYQAQISILFLFVLD